MALIDLLPGMGGETGALVGDAIQTIEDAVLCVGTATLDCWKLIIDVFLDAFDIWQTFFPSRPKVGKDSASDDTALFFIPSSNPIIQLWGAGIRNLEGQGIPTSASGGAGYTAQLALATAVAHDLARQFDGANYGKVLFAGQPVTGQQVFDFYHQLGFVAQHPDSNSTAIYERTLVDQLYTDLVNQKLIDPKTGFPPTTPPPPPKCPAGQHWDATLNKCVPDTPPTCPPGMHWDATKKQCVPDIVPPPIEQPDQDEFQDCCDETQANLRSLVNALSGLSGGGDPACCTNVIAALSGLGNQLRTIAIQLSNMSAGGLDLAPLETELAAIAKALGGLSIGGATPINVHIDNPAQDITINAPPTDIAPIVDQLAKLVKEGDVAQTVLDYLTSNGFLTGADAQVIQGAGWADAITGVFRTWGWNAVSWALSLVGITWTGKKFDVSFASFENAIAGDFAGAVNRALAAGSAPLYPEIKGLIDGVVAQLRPAAPHSLGNSGVDPELLVAKTLAPALIINAVSWVFGYLGWEVSEQLKEYVDLASELTGLAEVKEIFVGQLMSAGPIAAARLRAQQTFRQSLPGAGEVTSWVARGIMPNAQAAPLLALGGFEDSLHAAQMAAATSGISARQLIRLLATGLFTDADIADELSFTGMRARSQHRYQLVAPYLATNPERTQLKSALEAQYSAGLITDVELTDAIDGAEHNTDRNSLILDRVHALERTAIAKALEQEYTAMYLGSLTDHATYTANLAGMGLQQWKVDALAGVADAKRAVTLARQMAAAERQLERATVAAERKAAMQSFADGHFDAAMLAAALVATGLTAAQAAAWASLATLKQQGSLRWVYGLQLQPAQATLLKERVAALTEQLVKGYITAPQYINHLDALKIPAHWQNGLLAKAEATIAKTKGGALLNVQTS